MATLPMPDTLKGLPHPGLRDVIRVRAWTTSLVTLNPALISMDGNDDSLDLPWKSLLQISEDFVVMWLASPFRVIR